MADRDDAPATDGADFTPEGRAAFREWQRANAKSGSCTHCPCYRFDGVALHNAKHVGLGQCCYCDARASPEAHAAARAVQPPDKFADVSWLRGALGLSSARDAALPLLLELEHLRVEAAELRAQNRALTIARDEAAAEFARIQAERNAALEHEIGARSSRRLSRLSAALREFAQEIGIDPADNRETMLPWRRRFCDILDVLRA